jgi:uncharacterized surface protein with fasciclin (FAS1) repeats
MFSKRKLLLPVMALVAALPLVAIACGSDDEPPAPTATPTTQAMAPAADIVDTAVAAGSFTTLAAALEAADLIDTLKGAGPFTVFAPTDEAFAKLPAGTVEGLLADPDALRAILLYHVVAGEVPASAVVNLSEAATVNGATVDISVENGMVKINDSTVTTADVEASNGIIHIIDTVLIPE